MPKRRNYNSCYTHTIASSPKCLESPDFLQFNWNLFNQLLRYNGLLQACTCLMIQYKLLDKFTRWWWSSLKRNWVSVLCAFSLGLNPLKCWDATEKHNSVLTRRAEDTAFEASAAFSSPKTRKKTWCSLQQAGTWTKGTAVHERNLYNTDNVHSKSIQKHSKG